MNSNSIVQILIYSVLLTGSAYPLGVFIAWSVEVEELSQKDLRSGLDRIIEKIIGRSAHCEMTWRQYAFHSIIFSSVGFFAVYGMQEIQERLPLNPDSMPSVESWVAFNTAISFITNTNWQAYAGEGTLSYLTQMAALCVQNFVSAGVGIAVLIALIRGFTRKESDTIGNFWIDISRVIIFTLLPLSFFTSLFLVYEGVPQTFNSHAEVQTLESVQEGTPLNSQMIALGPVASQEAVKQLGTNGGGFFNANSAHPFENPTPFSNLISMIAILLIPAALCHTFGVLIGDRRQGVALYAVMFIVFSFSVMLVTEFESKPNAALEGIHVDSSLSEMQPGGNMEGKEVRFGIVNSAIWAVATTAASNGSVNSMHDSFSPLGGMILMLMMQFGEVIFGGVGSGLYGMIMFALVAVFISGLMVGRTPEYLGKKIESFEMKMVSLAVLIPCALVLIGTAIGVTDSTAASVTTNPGAHAFSQFLYAYSSMANNNGSAFAGFGATTPIHLIMGGVCMFISRFWLIIAVLAIAGSLASKKSCPLSAGTLETHTPLFIFLLIGIIFLVGALTFIPALALGPIVEQLSL